MSMLGRGILSSLLAGARANLGHRGLSPAYGVFWALLREPPRQGGEGSQKPHTPYPQLNFELLWIFKSLTQEDAHLTRIPKDSDSSVPKAPTTRFIEQAGWDHLACLLTSRLTINSTARGLPGWRGRGREPWRRYLFAFVCWICGSPTLCLPGAGHGFPACPGLYIYAREGSWT